MRIIAITTSILLALSVSAFAEGDVKKGKKVFKKCAACHALEEGKNKVGPSLYGILDRPAGTVEGFKYSKVVLESGIIWDDESLRAYITKPKKFLKGTKMAFAGLKKEKDLNNLMAYLIENTKPAE
ncbi:MULTISPECIES: c-type cytochrome [unclassified Lentilitoribacter]|jgi:cytochrome c|uniref:c-type cytochrome n=1 Tax=unclassified Lentilitoribacter TaxID=2647570 RepID=UPI0013A6FD8E|nr:cytochrome c family protein [Lentilitoribacter sp. Alg239-R112]